MNASGWNAAITGYGNRWFGLTGDLSGAYRSVGVAGLSANTFTGGPRFVLRGERLTPFAHLLAGAFHGSMEAGPLGVGLEGFAMMAGGGLDVAVSKRVAARLFQLDWILWNSAGMTEKKNARVSGGIALRREAQGEERWKGIIR